MSRGHYEAPDTHHHPAFWSGSLRHHVPAAHITFEDHLQPQTATRVHSAKTGLSVFNTLCLQHSPTFADTAKTARNLGFTEKTDQGAVANPGLNMAYRLKRTQKATSCGIMFPTITKRGEVRAFARDKLKLREFDVRTNPAAAGRATSLMGVKPEAVDFYIAGVENSPNKPAVFSLIYLNKVPLNGSQLNFVVLDVTVPK